MNTGLSKYDTPYAIEEITKAIQLSGSANKAYDVLIENPFFKKMAKHTLYAKIKKYNIRIIQKKAIIKKVKDVFQRQAEHDNKVIEKLRVKELEFIENAGDEDSRTPKINQAEKAHKIINDILRRNENISGKLILNSSTEIALFLQVIQEDEKIKPLLNERYHILKERFNLKLIENKKIGDEPKKIEPPR